MSSSVSYKPLLRTEQRRQQQRSNEAQHQIHLTLFASSFHHPHSLFPFCFLPRSLCFALGQWVEPHWRNPRAVEWVSEQHVSFCKMEKRQEQGQSCFQAALPCHPGHFHIPLNFNFPLPSLDFNWVKKRNHFFTNRCG